MLNRGQSLAKEDFDLGLKTDQELFEIIAAEYNKKDIYEYDQPQFLCLLIAKSNSFWIRVFYHGSFGAADFEYARINVG